MACVLGARKALVLIQLRTDRIRVVFCQFVENLIPIDRNRVVFCHIINKREELTGIEHIPVSSGQEESEQTGKARNSVCKSILLHAPFGNERREIG